MIPHVEPVTDSVRPGSTPRHRAWGDPSSTARGPLRFGAALLGLALISGTAPSALAQSSAARATGNLVANGGFESGTTGWTTKQATHRLSTGGRSVSGEASAKLTRLRPGRVILDDLESTVSSADADLTYAVTAFVRSTGRDVLGRVRVQEWAAGGAAVTHRKVFTATDDRWTKVQLTIAPETGGAALDLNVVGLELPRRVALLVDDVSMTAAEPPVDNPPPSATACVADPMGIPEPGQTYLGAAVSGSTDVETREAQLGRRLALHRTYYKADQIDRAVRNATADLALGRLPWISFKAPLSWADMAAGKGDAWSTKLAEGLKTVPGPVWLAVHHEPENDGDMALWTQMQAEIAPIIHAGTDNVAYSVIYSGWNTFGGGNNTVATKWPGDEHIDILAIDAYNDYGAVRNGREGTKVLDLKTYYAKMAAWAKEHGTAWAIGETGQTAKAAAVDPTWLDRTYQDMVDMGGAGLSYYDSTANSVADWTLDDPIKFGRFKGLQPASAKLC